MRVAFYIISGIMMGILMGMLIGVTFVVVLTDIGECTPYPNQHIEIQTLPNECPMQHVNILISNLDKTATKNEPFKLTGNNETIVGFTDEYGGMSTTLCKNVKYDLSISNRTTSFYPLEDVYVVTLK